MVGRVLRGAGALGALLLTPVLVLSFHDAYPSDDESPPEWLDSLRGPLATAGLLDGEPEPRYSRYGLLFGLGIALVVVGAALLVGRLRLRETAYRGPVVLLLACLAALVGGIGVDYAGTVLAVSAVGFLVQWLGFLGCIVAAGWAGSRWRDAPGALLAGLLAVLSVAAGLLATRHIPTGPALPLLLLALASAVREPGRPAARAQPMTSST